MNEQLEKICEREGTSPLAFFHDLRHKFPAYALGLLTLCSYCGDTEEEKCCDCLAENDCIQESKDECMEIFSSDESIEADKDCVRENGCYTPCAKAGAYFK